MKILLIIALSFYVHIVFAKVCDSGDNDAPPKGCYCAGINLVCVVPPLDSAVIYPIQSCDGFHPKTFQTLKLTFVDRSLSKNAKVELADGARQNPGSYTITRIIGSNSSAYIYDLGFDGGFSYDNVRIVQKFPSGRLLLEVATADLVKRTILTCK